MHDMMTAAGGELWAGPAYLGLTFRVFEARACRFGGPPAFPASPL